MNELINEWLNGS